MGRSWNRRRSPRPGSPHGSGGAERAVRPNSCPTTQSAVRAAGELRVEPIAAAYVTGDGDVLDEICWRRYGREDAVPAVLAANPGLADAAPILPPGSVLILPDLSAAAPRMPAARLWDVAPAGGTWPERRDIEARLFGVAAAAVRVIGALS